MSTDDEEDDWSDYDYGPFCRHRGDPGDCFEMCAACGHRCTDHGFFADAATCDVDGCKCSGWKDLP